MTVTALPFPALPVRVLPERHHAPALGAVLRRMGTSLAIACAVPATVFYTLFSVAGVWTAMLTVLVWSYAVLGWRALTGRRTTGILVLTTLVLTCRTAVSLVSGSTFVYFLQPILTDCLVGAAFLVSLGTARPMVARLAGDFYPMSAELAERPAVRRLMRRLTLMWAALAFGKAAVTLWLLTTQPLETFVPVKAVLALLVNAGAMSVTLAAATCVARREARDLHVS